MALLMLQKQAGKTNAIARAVHLAVSAPSKCQDWHIWLVQVPSFRLAGLLGCGVLNVVRVVCLEQGS
eukprot:5974620-Amphidinium_carterae.1